MFAINANEDSVTCKLQVLDFKTNLLQNRNVIVLLL